ncbi:MAG: sigma 54-interacting transcriptional regulator [Nitrospirae bacterium]|nr:sigma 54-interacting transcriptional regulator [Nitrospirota bacterium]
MATLVAGRLDLHHLLGQGHFGRVFSGFDRVLGRRIAAKEFCGREGKAPVRTFEKEMRLLSQLRHPSLVQVYDLVYDEANGNHYLTEELIEGPPLDGYLSRVGEPRRLLAFVQVLQGLEYLHQRGIVHLDIKPSNILVAGADSPQPQAKILDFGIADETVRVSRSAFIAGTFPYIAPEMARREAVDGRADLYALGMTFFRALADPSAVGGRSAPHGEKESADASVGERSRSLEDMLCETATRTPPTEQEFREGVSLSFRKVLITLLDPEPRRRFWSANDVIRRLNHELETAFPLEPGRVRIPDKATALAAGLRTELGRLAEWHEAFRQPGSASFVGIIAGSAQTGKSALLDEFRRWCELRDIFVVSPSRGGDGVADLFAQLLAREPLPDLGPWAPYLKSIVPARFRDVPDPAEVEQTPDLHREALREKWAEALSCLLLSRPTVLLLDDVDLRPELLALLERLRLLPDADREAPAGSTQGFFLVATATRREGLPLGLLADEVLELLPWPRERVERFLAELLGVERMPDQTLREAMSRTESRPGFLVEFARWLAAHALAPGEAVDVQLEAVDWSRMPSLSDGAEWCRNQLKEVPHTDRQVLEWLCLAPLPLTPDDVETLELYLSGLVLPSIRRLSDLGWIREDGVAAIPASSLRREVVLGELTSEGRARMSRRLAERWDRLSLAHEVMEAPSGNAGLERARAFWLGGEADKGFELAQSELEVRLRLHRPDEVAGFLRSVMREADAMEDSHRNACRWLLARAALATGNYPEAARVLEEAEIMAGSPREHMDVVVALARAYRYGGRLADALLLIEGEKGKVTPGSGYLSTLDALLADLLLEQGRYDDVTRLAQPYTAGSRPSRPGELFAFRHVLAKVHFYQGRVREAIGLFEENLQAVRAEGAKGRIPLALNALGSALLEAGEVARALALLEECVSVAKKVGDLRGRALGEVNLGVGYQRKGEWIASLRHYETALTILRRISDRANVARTLLNIGVIRSHTLDLEGARNALVEAAREAEALGMTHLLANVHVVRSNCGLLKGDFESARQDALTAERLFRQAERPEDAAFAGLRHVEALLGLGLTDEAGGELDRHVAALGPAPDEPFDALILYLRGLLLPKGEADRCRSILNQALARAPAGTTLGEDVRKKVGFRLARMHVGSEARNAMTRLPLSDGRWSSKEGGMESPDPAKEPLPESTTAYLPSDRPAPSIGRAPNENPRGYSLAAVEVVRKMSLAVDVQDVLVEIVDSLLGFTGAERGFLLILENGDLKVRVGRQAEGKDLSLDAATFSLTIAEECIEKRAAVVALDAMQDSRFKESESVYQFHVQSVMAVPLALGHEIVGAIYLDTRLRKRAFGDQDVEVLTALADLAAVAIQRARLMAQNLRDQKELRRTLRELKESRSKIEALNEDLRQANEKLSRRVTEQEEELETVRERIKLLVQEGSPKYRYDQIIGQSPALRRVLLLLDKAVESRIPVHISGASGTGKELFARALHFNSTRKEGPFVPVNCSAIPADLFEAELFGYVRGAFTGAEREKPGLFELAHTGALFLDEVADLPLGLQAKLLRVLQEGVVRRVGGTREVAVDVRVVSASNQDLKALVEQKRFREDLYFRLGVFRIEIPALRERREDVPPLVQHILGQVARAEGVPSKEISPRALRLLQAYDWPGNVRELENTIRNAVVMSEGPQIQAEAFSQKPELLGGARPSRRGSAQGLREAMIDFQKQMLLTALERRNWNITAAARDLKVDRSQLSNWIRKFSLAKRRSG